MPSFEEEFPWERARSRWHLRSDAPLTHYEFVAEIEPLERKMDVLYDRINDLQERLVETRAKRVAVDLIATGVGRLFLLVMTVILTLVAAKFYDWP